MKTLKFFIVLCFIMAATVNIANAQKVTDTQTVFWYFDSNFIPCLTEPISGSVVEEQSFTNKTYHVKPRGVLYGASGDAYDIKYEWSSFISPTNSFDWHASLPMTLWHDGKLIAVLHWVFICNYNGKNIIVVEKTLQHVNCK